MRDQNGALANYYIVTTLTNQNEYDFEFLKNAYRKRWTVETHIKTTKENLKISSIRSKSINLIKQDVACIHFTSIINCYIEYLLKPNDYEKINTNTCIQIVTTHVLKHILYPEKYANNTSKIINILNKIKQDIIPIIPDRKFKYASKKPRNKWGTSGTTSGGPKTKNRTKVIKKTKSKNKNKISNRQKIKNKVNEFINKQ